jgi:hypothetical protein
MQQCCMNFEHKIKSNQNIDIGLTLHRVLMGLNQF